MGTANHHLEADNTKRNVSKANAQILGKAFWSIVRNYGFSRVEQATLLGIKPNNRDRLITLERANLIPVEADKFLRVGFLLGIHKSLRILFPFNRNMVYAWMKTPQPLMGGRIPIEYIQEDPIDSIRRLFSIRRLLDQVRCG